MQQKNQMRFQRHGATTEQIQDYLLEMISVDATGCFNWRGWKCCKGYGTIVIERKLKHAHRVSYEVFRRPIPKGAWVLHRCDNPSCINPSHLFLGTRKDNMGDCKAKGRNAFGEFNGRHRLTETQVRDIRHRSSNGESKASIAKRFRISKSHAFAICNGTFWKKVK